MHKYIMEFIGTFFLVLGIGLSNDPLTIGLILAAMIYIGAGISNAHYNPAVSLAFLLQRKISINVFFGYITSQILAGLAAATVVFYLLGSPFFIEPPASSDQMQIILVEMLFTFVLVFVILVLSLSKPLKNNHVYGFAIGLTVTGIIVAGGPISGAVYNPAVFIGFSVIDAIREGVSYQLIPLYSISAFLGGVLASMAYTYFRRQSPNTF